MNDLAIERALSTLPSSSLYLDGYQLLKRRVLTVEMVRTTTNGLNDHGPQHIERVLHKLDELLGPEPLTYVNPLELWLAMMGVLYHDVGIAVSREGHPEIGRRLLADDPNSYVFRPHEREVIEAAIVCHGSQANLEKRCASFGKQLKIGDHKIDPKRVCALVRIADELDEDYRRGDVEVFRKIDIAKNYPDSVPFWRFNQRISGVDIDPPGQHRQATIFLCFESEDLSLRARSKARGELPFIDFAFEKILKIHSELSLCSRFLPERLALSSLRVELRSGRDFSWTAPISILFGDPPPTFEEVLAKLPQDLRARSIHLLPPTPPPSPTPLAGWRLLDEAALAASRRELQAHELVRYFDGRIPSFLEAQSARIPRRHIVGELAEQLHLASGGAPGGQMILLLGAGGEGKSTVLRQVAVDAAATAGWSVLWREPGGNLDAMAAAKLPAGRRWLLVSDDADAIVEPLFELVRALAEAGRGDIDLLLCCRGTDWEMAGGSRRPWATLTAYHERRLRGLDAADAKQIIDAWATLGEAGLGRLAKLKRRKDQVSSLLQAARSEVQSGDGALLGALLRTRFGQSPAEHVKVLLGRLSGYSLSNGVSLLRAFLSIAAAHAAGLDTLMPELLALTVDLDPNGLSREVILPLSEEAAVEHCGRFVLVRHRAIAEAALAQAQVFREDPAVLYSRFVSAATAAERSDLYLMGDLNRFLFLARLFVGEFEERRRDRRSHDDAPAFPYFSEAVLARIAYRCAETAIAPPLQQVAGGLRRIAHFANVVRRLGEPAKAVDALLRLFPQFSTLQDYKMAIRSVYTEWATAMGRQDRPEIAAWLQGLAIADGTGDALTIRDAKNDLVGLGVCFRALTAQSPAFLPALAAVVTLAESLDIDERTRDTYFRHFERFLGESGVAAVPIERACAALAAGIEAAARRCPKGQLPAAIAPESRTLSFKELNRMVIKLPRR